jgi:hypothetical protein
MQLIFGKEAADQMRDRFTVLELDTMDYRGTPVTVYCVIAAEDMPLGELQYLEENKRLHAYLIEQISLGDSEKMLEAISHLRGKFGGAVDSYYDEVIKRMALLSE